MTIFVYTTKKCKDDALRHAISDELERFAVRVEKSQNTNQFDPFPPPYLVKKKLGGQQGRLIAEKRHLDDHAVVVFLAIMIRGDKDYQNHFAVDPVAYGRQHFSNLVSDESLAEYIANRTRIEPPPSKPQPSDAEYGFLYQVFAHRENPGEEDMVYETIEWKEACMEDRVANQLVRFADPCVKALLQQPGIRFLEITDKAGWGLWIHRSEGRLLLISPVTDTTTNKAEEIKERYREILEQGDLTSIIRSSRRAYPAYMLADEDTWLEIEKEPVANMALSPEESDVLLSARRTEGAFPLFVNGRAGSGKSTILQYLFADLLFYYLNTPAVHAIAPPVYLTANGELLRVARSFIERILRNEAVFLGSGSGNLADDNRVILDKAFQEFQPHLLSMVDVQTRRKRFGLSKRVDYSQFRRLWTNWFGKEPKALRNFGPDISWHVIRSYVKGMLSETVMDPDDYRQLPENQVTVTKETFATVFERVWEKNYCKIDQEGLWDDQDLVRLILDNDLATPASPAVFCDEAQDFTRIELELLLRLNLFSDRSVPPHDLSRVPFAFAGDQFQTLNPTGFRWDAIKAAFVEKFIYALDPRGRSSRTELNYNELRYNYRSTPPIVRFSNGVQALRSALFKMRELRPQIPWTQQQTAFPIIWFDSGDAAFWRKFKETESFVVIVPCNEGEEFQFVGEDPILNQHIHVEDKIPQNVLSAARAKGQEYPVVVVYGFGKLAPENLMESLDCTDSDSETAKDRLLPLQYFINRLYVAVSRPKQRLIVVDSESGINHLWAFANREEVATRVINAANSGRSVWNIEPENPSVPVVEGMTMGKAEDLTRESAGDPKENARTYEEDGIARKDPFLLRQAVLAWRSAGEPMKATECRARALELDGEYLASAQAFAEAGFVVPEAVRCFWKAGKDGRHALVELGKSNANVARETEFKFARALEEPSASPAQAIELLEELVNRLSESTFSSYAASEKAWREAINNFVNLVANDTSVLIARRLEDVLEKIEAFGISQEDRKMAEIHFRVGSLEKAVKRWEKAGETRSNDYLTAKAEIEPYPAKLASLTKVGAIDKVIQEFEAHQNTDLDSVHWDYISAAYLESNRLNEAFDTAWNSRNATVMRKIALRSIENSDPHTALQALYGAFIAMVGGGDWEPLSKFASILDFSPDASWSEDAPKELVESHANELQCTLVSALARSEKFVEAPGQFQRQFNEFLRRFLRVRERSWHRSVSVEEAGAAIERGGRFTDALPFYEAVVKDPSFSEEQKLFARSRWIVCKNRQLDYEHDQAGQSRRASEIQRELSDAMKRCGIERVSDLPKYPNLTDIEKPPKPLIQNLEPRPIEPSTELPTASEADPAANVDSAVQIELADRFVAKIGDFSIDLSRRIGRCNISNESTMQTAFFNLRDNQPGGEKSWRAISTTDWVCEDWHIRLSHSTAKLIISFDDLGVCFSIDRPVSL